MIDSFDYFGICHFLSVQIKPPPLFWNGFPLRPFRVPPKAGLPQSFQNVSLSTKVMTTLLADIAT